MVSNNKTIRRQERGTFLGGRGMKRSLVVNSADRDETKYPNPNEYRVDLPREYRNVTAARLTSAELPRAFEGHLVVPIDTTIVVGTGKNLFPNERTTIPTGIYNIAIVGAVIDSNSVEVSEPQWIQNIPVRPGDRTQWTSNNTDSMQLTITDHESNATRTYTLTFDPGVDPNEIQELSAYVIHGQGYRRPNPNPGWWYGIFTEVTVPAGTYTPASLVERLNYLVGCNAASFTYSQTLSLVASSKWIDLQLSTLGANSPELFAQLGFIEVASNVNFFSPNSIVAARPMTTTAALPAFKPYLVLDIEELSRLDTSNAKSAFAKIPVLSNNAVYFDKCITHNYYDQQPIARLRTLRVRLRDPDGSLVDFQGANHSLTLELTTL